MAVLASAAALMAMVMEASGGESWEGEVAGDCDCCVMITCHPKTTRTLWVV